MKMGKIFSFSTCISNCVLVIFCLYIYAGYLSFIYDVPRKNSPQYIPFKRDGRLICKFVNELHLKQISQSRFVDSRSSYSFFLIDQRSFREGESRARKVLEESRVIASGMTEEARTRIRADEVAYRRHSRNSCVLLHRADLICGDKQRELELVEHVVTITATFLRSYRPTRAGMARRVPMKPEWSRVVAP